MLKRLSGLFLAICIMCVFSCTAFAHAAESSVNTSEEIPYEAKFNRSSLLNAVCEEKGNGEFLFTKQSDLLNSDDEFVVEVTKVKTLDSEAYSAWKAVSDAKAGVNQSLVGSAYDTSGWVLMSSTLYFTKEVSGTITFITANKATYSYDRGQPTIVVNSIKSVLSCASLAQSGQVKSSNTVFGSNTTYTITAPSSWTKVNIQSPGAMIGSYLEMSFTRGGSSWSSKLSNEYVNNLQ
ncbi:hypothetical protein [Fusibacillus kribbianus]|uniref:Uncharacterized protein n=1 Tax=Fusibacillus kribbianus TaxID=3044208 RepID=A0AAP4BCA4_9FIRM|nr:hypothetical protein [Ruminococcus sp. YH-rum2234]MDI9242328.1 hypothetical protein [Ruminococcus sp. YH-rum2234]